MRYKLIIFDVSGTLVNGYGQPYPQMKESLEKLHQAGFTLALATNLSQSGLEQFVKESGLQNMMPSYKSAQATAYKPHPLMIEEILIETGMSPEETLMVGDTGGDIHMAHNAKVNSCLIGWDGQFSRDAVSANPHEKVESLSELVNSLIQG